MCSSSDFSLSSSISPPAVEPAPSSSSAKETKTQFSTADRTILEELKRNIHARNAQFVLKGVGVHLTDGTVSLGKRHHPYSRHEVPYPRSYDREVVDMDVWETLFCQDICESLTWHVFDEPPLKVLDIGCGKYDLTPINHSANSMSAGTGTWILNCARTWRVRIRDTLSAALWLIAGTGLDLVPLHPHLQQVGSEYASRITWVQTNFLEGLPFPNDEFDFVHVKRIALGVPEDKWDALFDEIYRVMKPGAAFEMLEEDLFFPGKAVESDDDADLASPLSRASSITSAGGRSSIHLPSKPLERYPHAESSVAATPTPGSAFPKTVSRPASPDRPPRASLSREDGGDRSSPTDTTTPPGSPPGYVKLIAPHSRSAARPTLYVRTGHNSSTSAFPSTHPPKHHSAFNGSTTSLLNSVTDSENHLFRRRRSSTNLSSAIDFHGAGQGLHSAAQQTSSTSFVAPPHITKPQLPYLLRTPDKAPINPRDHSLLEYIYYETLSSRFINSTPLSLLTTYLEYHFKGK
ncbi:hypothetical protein NMY22_g4306 [Coprinellus aureogranulatus]|nr:hypothetical protein NMY22_g4306 [Coprinellus aureogranulatus]